MKTTNNTTKQNLRYSSVPASKGYHKSPFASMTPSGAITKHFFNIKSRIKDGAKRTSSGAFIHGKKEFSE